MAALLANFDTAHCGIVHDAQLDNYGHCLATASADGHVRLWDTRNAEEPTFLSDLGGHAGAVHQVSWAPAELGVLLASAGSDGSVMVWGQHSAPGDWRAIHCERLKSSGAVYSVEWAPAEHGALLACASADGSVTVVGHQGSLVDSDGEVAHHWQSRSFSAHQNGADAVSWASSSSLQEGPVGLSGARLATVGGDGLKVWSWHDGRGEWEAGAMDASSSTQAPPRDVAWKPRDGVSEIIAVAAGKSVVFWYLEAAEGSSVPRWHAKQHVNVKEEVWKVSWMEMGSVLMLSCGEDEQTVILLKQRLSGSWDVMDVDVQ